MADITITPAGAAFDPTDTVTSTRLNEARNPTAALDAGTIVNADVSATADILGSKLADATVTKAKIENISAPLRVLGRTTVGAGVAEEVTINDNDDLSTASAITLATDQSIKAYVDATAGGFTPSTYAGEESVTLPNGMIMKTGIVTASISGTSVSFGVAFPNGVVSALACPNNGANLTQGTGYSGKAAVDSLTTSGMNVSCDGSAYWQAIGY